MSNREVIVTISLNGHDIRFVYYYWKALVSGKKQ